MRKIILAVALMSATGIAFASGSHKSHKPTQGQGQGQGQTQGQGQDQGQSQGQGQSQVAKGGSVNNSGNSQSTSQSSSQAGFSNSGNSSTSVNVTSTEARQPVNSAYAAPLTTSNDTCMGSTSVGGQGITFGISFGTTWTDKDCVRRKDARFLYNTQNSNLSLGLMCNKPEIRQLVERTGTPEQRRVCLDTINEVTPVSTEVDSRDSNYGSGERG